MKDLGEGRYAFSYGKTGLMLKPDTIIVNHPLELSGTRVKYLENEKRAYKHEI